MKPIAITALTAEHLTELAVLYRTTRDVRLRTRARMVLLAAARDFFERYNQCPNAVLSIIGSHATIVV